MLLTPKSGGGAGSCEARRRPPLVTINSLVMDPNVATLLEGAFGSALIEVLTIYEGKAIFTSISEGWVLVDSPAHYRWRGNASVRLRC